MGQAASIDCLVAFNPELGELRDVAVRYADQDRNADQRLLPLARGLYETSRFMLYDNVRQ